MSLGEMHDEMYHELLHNVKVNEEDDDDACSTR